MNVESPSGGETENGYRYDSIQPLNDDASSTAHNATSLSTAKPKARMLGPDLLRGVLLALMAMDHLALGLHAWQHGTNLDGEEDGAVVRKWNRPAAYVVRTLTHLCAPGFMFLLGMGVVFLARSRTKLGWSTGRLLRYFALRGLVLTLVTVVFGLIFSGGTVWFLNIVLFALGVNYFIAGVVWILLDKTEKRTSMVLEDLLLKNMSVEHTAAAEGNERTEEVDQADEEENVRRPLLPRTRQPLGGTSKQHRLASDISWHLHNGLLAALAVITILWNFWLSESHGRCTTDTAAESARLGSSTSPLLLIWYRNVITARINSNFPPLPWLSFAIMGLLYGRFMAARAWSQSKTTWAHVVAAALFGLVFVLTRILQVGNLSEGCLQTPDHTRHPDKNPYLVSAASFFYIVKYPPDVAFWSFTMSANLLLLAFFSGLGPALAQRLTVLLDFGTSSLFFYLVHMLLVFSPVVTFIKHTFGQETDFPDMVEPDSYIGVQNLFVFLATWVMLLLVMWPLCRYYSRFKSNKHADSLWRFF